MMPYFLATRDASSGSNVVLIIGSKYIIPQVPLLPRQIGFKEEHKGSGT